MQLTQAKMTAKFPQQGGWQLVKGAEGQCPSSNERRNDKK
jgi:hypothetical protein